MEYVLLDLLALGGYGAVRYGRLLWRLARTGWALWHAPPVRTFAPRPGVPDPTAGEIVNDADRLDFAAVEGEPA